MQVPPSGLGLRHGARRKLKQNKTKRGELNPSEVSRLVLMHFEVFKKMYKSKIN